jgi:HSP20 family molecular chaperone IbpA
VLPNSADAEKVQAEMKDGVLAVLIPKKATAQARRVEVKSP